jgi:hypothetical protein
MVSPIHLHRRRREAVIEVRETEAAVTWRVTLRINGTLENQHDFYFIGHALEKAEEFLHKSTWTDIFVPSPRKGKY